MTGQPRISERYRRMAAVYAMFARSWADCVDLSEDALREMHAHESRGGTVSPENGYALGKRWLNLHVTTWRRDIADGLLRVSELYDDPLFPHWWLDSIFSGGRPSHT